MEKILIYYLGSVKISGHACPFFTFVAGLHSISQFKCQEIASAFFFFHIFFVVTFLSISLSCSFCSREKNLLKEDIIKRNKISSETNYSAYKSLKFWISKRQSKIQAKINEANLRWSSKSKRMIIYHFWNKLFTLIIWKRVWNF